MTSDPSPAPSRRLRRSLTVALLAAGSLAAPAAADAATFCVAPATGCDTQLNADQVQQALSAAGSTPTDDTVRLGAATYTGAFTYSAGADSGIDSVVGAGRSQTTITALPKDGVQVMRMFGDPADARKATIRDLTVELPPNSSHGEEGLIVSEATARDLDVRAANGNNLIGLQLDDATFASGAVNVPTQTDSSRAVYAADGDASIVDARLTGRRGLTVSAPGRTVTVLRSRIRAALGATTDSGTIAATNTTIDLGDAPNAIGVAVDNYNPSPAAKAALLRHVTIAGGGADSIGVQVEARSPTVAQVSSATIADSVIAGPAIPIRRKAGNNGGALANSKANVTTRYSSYDTAKSTSENTKGGVGAITEETTPIGAPPAFADTDFHLTAASPLVDAGDPDAAGPTTDIDFRARIQDGDADGTARRDVGAHEFIPAPPVPPAGGSSEPGTPQNPAVDPVTPPIEVAGNGKPPVTTDTVRPTLRSLSLTRRVLNSKRPATLRFTASKAGTLRIALARLTPGRRKGKRCASAKRRDTGKRCVRVNAVPGAVTTTVTSGRGTVKLRTRLAGRTLPAGTYRLSATLTDAAHNQSDVARGTFRVGPAK